MRKLARRTGPCSWRRVKKPETSTAGRLKRRRLSSMLSGGFPKEDG